MKPLGEAAIWMTRTMGSNGAWGGWQVVTAEKAATLAEDVSARNGRREVRQFAPVEEARQSAEKDRGLGEAREDYGDALFAAARRHHHAVRCFLTDHGHCEPSDRQALRASRTPSEPGAEEPWDDCKVAFGFDDQDAFEAWMDETDDGKGLLPDGWSLCECDGSGARYVVVFRVENGLRREDGEAVAELLKGIASRTPSGETGGSDA